MKRLLLTAFTFLLLLGFAADSIAQEAGKEADEAKPATADDADDGGKAAEETSEGDQVPEIKTLTIGSPAPSLDVEHWVQDGEGQFGVVTDFEKGKVYIVEFWATWCGPCIASMPHIVELQKKYADKGVQVISISNEELETVEKFLDRTVRGSEDDENPETYRDLTSSYCLTTDPDGSSSEDYMRAANQNGIPCAFIVGKMGQVEWIGHPMSMDDALDQVVTDAWDRDAFRAEFVAQQQAQEILSRVSRAMRSGATDEAVELLDDYIDNGTSQAVRMQFKQIKFQVLASDKETIEQAADYAIAFMDDDSHDASSANDLARRIYQYSDAGRFDDERVAKSALKFARSKVKDAGEMQPYLLDTVAHLQHLLGNSKQALKTQRRAMKAASAEQKPRLEGFLKELEELAQPKPPVEPEQAAQPDAKAAEDATEKEEVAADSEKSK